MNKIRLSEVATVELSSIDKKIEASEIPVKLCNFTDVYYNWSITKNVVDACMDGSVNDTEYSKFSLKKGQVAITKDSETRDDIGMSTYISEDFDNAVLAYHCALITPKQGKVNGKYLNALFNDSYGRRYFANQASGSGQRYTLSKEAIESIEIPLPSIEKQNAIGSFFSNIDKKIELNNRINDNLIEQARTLFNYWFLQFNFPDDNGRPYLSSGGNMVFSPELKRLIPTNWGTTTVEKICLCHDSKRVPLSSNERLSMHGDYPYFGATDVMDHVNNYIFDGDYVLLAEDGSIMDKSGHPILQRIQGKCWINNHAHVLEPVAGYSCLLLYMLLKDIPVIKIKTGSVQYKITQEKLNQFCIVDIPNDIRQSFISLTDPIDKQILKLKKENENLKQLRDWLLPMLMNGQVSISN